MIEVTEVRKRFGRSGRWVLAGVDLTAAAGTVTVLAGGNGSGKSTLLRILAGASRPTSGRVLRPHRSVAYVPERLPARTALTAERYLAHAARLRGLGPVGSRPRIRELLDRLAVQPGPLSDLSKGNRQKVVLAQAFLVPVRLVVLDEPFSGLDQPAAATLLELIGDSRVDGAAVVLSAHRPDALRAADAVRLLDGGRLRAVDADAPAWSVLVLRPRADAVPLDGARWDPATGEAIVHTTDPDALLRTALAAGWSFVRGGPA